MGRHVTQIVDWFHAAERLWLVGKNCISAETQRHAEAILTARAPFLRTDK